VVYFHELQHLQPGISLNGASLNPDSDANQRLYDKTVSAREIVLDNAVTITPAGQSLVTLLDSKDWH